MKNLFLYGSTILAVISLLLIVKFATGNTTSHFEEKTSLRKNSDKVHKYASNLEHFDEDFEGDFEGDNLEDEFFEHVENYKKRGADSSTARQMSYKKMEGKYGTKFKKHVSTKSGNLIKGNPYHDVTAMFDITILRKSVNIGLALPVPLFGAVHYSAKYQTFINNYLPSSVTITNITVNSAGSVVIEYTEGANVDTIVVSCVQVPYITFLTSSQFNAMMINKFRYQISDTAQLTQFNQTFDTVCRSLFGKYGSNQVSVGAQKSPQQFQSGIIDVDFQIPLNYEQGIVCGLIAVDEFSVTLSCFVSRYNRTNVNP